MPLANQWQNTTRNGPTMKKRQARKILKQVLQQNQPVTLPDGQRASKRAVRRAARWDPNLLMDKPPRELKSAAGLAKRLDSARRRQQQSSNRSFKRAIHSRASRAPVGADDSG
ncbi:MAG: hypothetical protein OXL37_03565 [Chloroflexota bacterium]|nr:hypothetical protein [Chloroflexota bacterium]MDE2958605.1 hypothetical protein [Chloroflexota bacterium]